MVPRVHQGRGDCLVVASSADFCRLGPEVSFWNLEVEFMRPGSSQESGVNRSLQCGPMPTG